MFYKCDENDVVFDGFIGSGTTMIAAMSLNRRYIGYELDKYYFDIAMNRINNFKTYGSDVKELLLK
jgi:site-specific DNA-methyltransferase (adenine-specific)